MARTALYAGSFDPLTNGHLDVIRRACGLADRLVLAVGVHPGKAPLFSAAERVAMLEEAAGPVAAEHGAALEVATFDDLVVAVARRVGARILVRGVRDGTDLDDELRMAGMNGTMAPEVQTVLLPASPAVRPIAATLVRQIASMGGDVRGFVPPAVADRLEARFKRAPA